MSPAKSTYPSIMLPGPVVAPYTVTIRAASQNWRGEDIQKEVSFAGDGSGIVQVLDEMQADYSGWHPYLGEEIFIDYGNGPTRGRILDERFGQLFFVPWTR